MLTKHDRHRISVSNRQSCSDKIIGHLERPNDTLIRTLSSLIIILILTSFECLSLLLILFFFFKFRCYLPFDYYSVLLLWFLLESKWGQVFICACILSSNIDIVFLFICWLFLKCPVHCQPDNIIYPLLIRSVVEPYIFRRIFHFMKWTYFNLQTEICWWLMTVLGEFALLKIL